MKGEGEAALARLCQCKPACIPPLQEVFSLFCLFRGRRSDTSPGIFRVVSKNTKPAVLPVPHTWLRAQPGGAAAAAQGCAVAELATAI